MECIYIIGAVLAACIFRAEFMKFNSKIKNANRKNAMSREKSLPFRHFVRQYVIFRQNMTLKNYFFIYIFPLCYVHKSNACHHNSWVCALICCPATMHCYILFASEMYSIDNLYAAMVRVLSPKFNLIGSLDSTTTSVSTRQARFHEGGEIKSRRKNEANTNRVHGWWWWWWWTKAKTAQSCKQISFIYVFQIRSKLFFSISLPFSLFILTITFRQKVCGCGYINYYSSRWTKLCKKLSILFVFLLNSLAIAVPQDEVFAHNTKLLLFTQ